ncbi:MAG: HEAT repeat domain-containing protein, partial [Planctomicrobium sp.]|nr:HEAT repeat domain-containing protein [Planctomicrobium sp.]
MANLQSQESQGFGIKKLIVLCLVLQITAPAFAQQNGVDTGVAPESVLPVEPDSLEGRLEAALLMVKLARPELGKKYIAEMLAMEPSGKDLIALRNKYGTSTFLSFTNVEGLNPEASELLSRLQTAVETETNDPAYAASLLPKLAGTAREREQALTDLRSLGPYAVPTILIAIENNTISRDLLVFNLARLGDEAVPPLIGALTAPSLKIRSAATEVLGVLGGKEDVIWLWHPAFAESQPTGVQASARNAIARISYDDSKFANRVTAYGSAARLLKESNQYLAGQHQWEMRYEDVTEIPVWTWDSQLGTVIETKTSQRNAAIHFAERLAREAAELSPANEDAPIALLAARMVRDIENAGWDQPVPTGSGTAHDIAVSTGPEVCNQVLTLAIDQNIPGAALSAVSALGLNGSRSQLTNTSSTPAIVEALNFPHPRVQFAAAISILQWEPKTSFSGSSRVIEILTRAVLAGSKPDSVVIDPNVERGTATANIFNDLGYDSSIAKTGRDGFQMAAKSG